LASKIEGRKKRKRRIRKKLSGTAARPRLCVFKSSSHIYAQVVDDAKGHTLAAASSMDSGMAGYKGHKGNKEAARKVGELIGRRAMGKDIKKVVFDRGGYLYHGRVRTLAEAAREEGLEF
jgi:large subunit ribosomal protein L18